MATGLSSSPSVVTSQEDALAVMEELMAHIKVSSAIASYSMMVKLAINGLIARLFIGGQHSYKKAID